MPNNQQQAGMADLREAVHAWIREDAPVSVKMALQPSHVDALVSRVAPLSADTAPPPAEGTFQDRVRPWMLACFGYEISGDKIERNHRFLEEALELVQACGCTQSEAHQLVDYVYGRPVGVHYQEVGGVMVTLAALCLAQGLDMHQCGETELARVWTKVEQIRAKQAAKPKHGPLPGPSALSTPAPASGEPEPIGYLKPQAEWAVEPFFIYAKDRTEEWAKSVFTIPVYAAPTPDTGGEYVRVPRALVDEVVTTLELYADPTGYTDRFEDPYTIEDECHPGIQAAKTLKAVQAALSSVPSPANEETSHG